MCSSQANLIKKKHLSPKLYELFDKYASQLHAYYNVIIYHETSHMSKRIRIF